MTYKTRNAEFSEKYKFNHNNNDGRTGETDGRNGMTNETERRKGQTKRMKHRIRRSLLLLVNVYFYSNLVHKFCILTYS